MLLIIGAALIVVSLIMCAAAAFMIHKAKGAAKADEESGVKRERGMSGSRSHLDVTGTTIQDLAPSRQTSMVTRESNLALNK